MAVVAQIEFGVVAIGKNDFWGGSWRCGDRVNRHLGFIFGLEINLCAVGCPCVGFDAAIEILGAVDGFAVLAVVEHEAPAIGLVSGLKLGAIGDPFSVGRICGAPIVAGIRGDAFGFARAGDVHREKIAVGA